MNMAIPKGDEANFETLRNAIKNDDACILSTKRKSDGKRVSLVCAVNKTQGKKGREFEMAPLAVLIEGNPYEMYDPPFHEDGQ